VGSDEKRKGGGGEGNSPKAASLSLGSKEGGKKKGNVFAARAGERRKREGKRKKGSLCSIRRWKKTDISTFPREAARGGGED